MYKCDMYSVDGVTSGVSNWTEVLIESRIWQVA